MHSLTLSLPPSHHVASKKERFLFDYFDVTLRPTLLSDEHWNCFKGNVGETSERRGGAHMGFSERIDTTFN